jgi:hypothetical protein
LTKWWCIDFGCSVLFKNIPLLIDQGIEKLEGLFGTGKDDKKVKHYCNYTRIVLQECLEYPICDVMLMMGLTLTLSLRRQPYR